MWKVFRIAVLIILMYLSLGGQYHENIPNITWDKANEYAFWNIVLVTILMGLVPALWTYINKGKLPKRKGKRICMWNSIVLCLVSAIIDTMTGFRFIGAIGAWFYYFINKWLFVDETNDSEPKEKKVIMCPHCNTKNKSHKEYCYMCGKLLEKSDEKEEKNNKNA